ncbi:MAG TPA: PilZ domain-containing protein [Candidatus Angelobacter sp.]|nr:PilZ domain-containing protein [Candidatus Angelobacter sp.]
MLTQVSDTQVSDTFTASSSGTRRKSRRSPRAKIAMHVKVWRTVKGKKKLVPGFSRNICQDGIAVFMPADIPLHEKLELQFTLPGSTREITVHAIVRGINKFQYGMEFTSLDGMSKQLLGSLVTR